MSRSCLETCFLDNIRIKHDNECPDSTKADQHAMVIWTKSIATVGKLLERKELNDVVVYHDDILVVLFVFQSLTLERTQTQRVDESLSPECELNDKTQFHLLVLQK